MKNNLIVFGRHRQVVLYGAAVAVALALIPVYAAFAATAAQLATSIPDAKNTFVTNEQICTADLAASRAKYPGASNYRTAINDADQYKYNNWLSLRNQPSQTSTAPLPAGNISVNLQFNQSLFMCAVLTNPASNTATPRAASRVTNSAYPNDRSIVRSGGVNDASLYRKDAKVVDTDVLSGGGSLSNANGSMRHINVDNSTRYNFAGTIPITYTANLKATTNVKIQMEFIELRTYHNYPGSSGSYTVCDHRDAAGDLSTHLVTQNRAITSSTFNDPMCNRIISKTYTITVRVIPPPNWTTSGTTTINRTTASPGDTVTWTHRLNNNGPDNTTKAITSYVGRTGFASNTNLSTATTATGRPRGVIRGPFTTNYTIQASDVGKTLCQRLRWSPSSASSNATLSATNRCVTVPYVYDLSPSLLGPSGAVSPGASIPDVQPRVTNQSPSNPAGTTITPNIVRWTVGRIDIPPNGTIDMNIRQNATTPQARYGATWRQLDTGTRSFPPNVTNLAAIVGENVAANAPVGTQVCFTIGVQPYSSASNLWRHGVPLCMTVNKRPSIQVWGSDLRATGLINTSTFQAKKGASNATFGSWVEYGAFSSGVNTNFASGSGLVKGYTGGSGRVGWSTLTFANTPTYGMFDFGTPADLTTQFLSAPATALSNAGVRDVVTLASGTYRPTGDLRITGTVPAGRAIIIEASGYKVTVEGNLNYGGQPYNSRDDIPQLVIIAQDIQINQSVTSVNAWLLASRTVDTCGNVGPFGQMPASGTVLKSDVCDKPLQVNGPVRAAKLILKRTAGADESGPGDSAEIFNLRSDAYLWLRDRAADKGQVRTISTREMPPRF